MQPPRRAPLPASHAFPLPVAPAARGTGSALPGPAAAASSWQPLGLLARPTWGTVGWSDLTRPGEAPVLRHLRASVSGRTEAGWHEATAQLEFHAAPREEVADLGLSGATRASAGWFGMTVTGAIAS